MGFISEGIKLKAKIAAVVCGVAAIMALSFFCYKSGVNKAEMAMAQAKPQINATTINQQLSDISQLSTVEYNYTAMGQFENSNDFYGVKLPFTTKSFVVSYDGLIKAGVDLSLADININGNEITISLPKSKILSHEVYEESLMVYDEKSGLFNSLSITDFNDFYLSQKKIMEQKATEKGVLNKATEKAKAFVENVLGQMLTDSGYTVRVEMKQE